MSIHYAEPGLSDLPAEERVLEEVKVRLVDGPGERRRHDGLMRQEHYLRSAKVVGQVLRYVAEYRGEWVAALTFCSSAWHMKPRDQLLRWTPRMVSERRHLIAQNSRFLVLASTGRWPNLASRVLKLVCARLGADWQEHFGHPVLLVETFVDPERFAGTCYRAANWQCLGKTRGFARRGRDYYLDREHPKELLVYALGRGALARLRAPVLEAALQNGRRPPPPSVPLATKDLGSLSAFLRLRVKDGRDPHGVRHPLVSVLGIAILAVAAGCQGPHSISEFAQSLNHGQRRLLGCRKTPGARRKCDVPCERTFRRLLEQTEPQELRQALSDWMATLDPEPVEILHLDGKVLRNASPAPARLPQDPALAQAAASLETAPDQQKPKADKALTLVNFQTPGQRLVDQLAVPCDTNEEAAVAAHLPQMDLAGVLLIGDAAHTVKANCWHLTREQGADYLFFLKGNQPTAFAKAKQLLAGDAPPSGRVDRQGPRTDRHAQTLGAAGGRGDSGLNRGDADLPH